MPAPNVNLYDLRCEVCRFRPLLARYGRDEKGMLFLWVKVFKQRRLYAEMILNGDGGAVRLRCRDCLRWHRVTIRQTTGVESVQEELPESIPVH